MEFRDLTYDAGVRQDGPDSGHHAIDVLALLHKSEAILEGDCADNVESVVLEPAREINWLAGSGSHFFHKDVGALVYVWFEGADGCHRELASHGLLKSFVVGGILGREHAGHECALIWKGHCAVEVRLKR